MKINILTSGRFHVLDLAVELQKEGHDICFYSYVPCKRILQFGLEKKSIKSVFIPMLPFLFLHKIFPKNLFVNKIKILFLDFFVSITMRKCDVVIAMSGIYVKSLEHAKSKNSIVIVERGSKHILEQKRILENVPTLKDKKPVPDFDVKREILSYNLADYISIPSLHVLDSFILHHFPEDKIFVNPYGVDITMFYKDPKILKEYDVIFVGNWGYQKGSDLLVEACLDLNLKLLHIGALQDLPFPENPNLLHLEPVNQNELIKYYNMAKVFALPSRQEGLALVQAQALACNLPVVCSKHTGGIDLKTMSGDKDNIFIMNEYSVSSLKENLTKALASRKNDLIVDLAPLTWNQYGRRYNEFLNDAI